MRKRSRLPAGRQGFLLPNPVSIQSGISMIKVFKEYENNPDVKMILQVHDEIILEVKEELAEEVGKKVKEIMESVYKLSVPLVVDVKIGDNWGEV